MNSKIKVFSVIFAGLYFVLSLGIGLKAHYCHGDLTSVSYVVSSVDCECGDEDSDMSCCSNEEKFFQLDEDMLLRGKSELSLQADLKPLEFHLGERPENIDKDILWNVEYPEINAPPHYIANSSLVFYA